MLWAFVSHPESELGNKRVGVLELLGMGPPSTPEPPSRPCGFSGLPTLLFFLGNPGEKLNFLASGGQLGFPLFPWVGGGCGLAGGSPPPLVEQSPWDLKGNPRSWGPPPQGDVGKRMFSNFAPDNSRIYPDNKTGCLVLFCFLTFLHEVRFQG